MKKWAGREICFVSTGPDYEQSKGLLLKVENVTSEVLKGSLSDSISEHSEESQQKIKKKASESTAPASKQPEGILQLIDKLETIVDQLLPR